MLLQFALPLILMYLNEKFSLQKSKIYLKIFEVRNKNFQFIFTFFIHFTKLMMQKLNFVKISN